MDEHLVHEAVAFFRAEPGFQRLIEKMIKKYQSLGRLGGTVVLTNLKPAEKEALGGFLRRDLTRQVSISLSVEKFSEALGQTKFAPVSLLKLLEGFEEGSLLTQSELFSIKEHEREEVITRLRQRYNDSWCQRWLGLIADKHPSTRWLWAYFEQNPSLFTHWMEHVLNALSTLHASEKFQRLPVLARSVTKDPHGFDQGTEQGRLLVNALTLLWLQEQGSRMKDAEVHVPQSAEVSRRTSEVLTEIFLHFGLLRDDILNFCTCTGVMGLDAGGVAIPFWREAYRQKAVLNLPLREVVKVERFAAGASGANKAVYVVENSGVFSALLDYWNEMRGAEPYPALICLHGQAKLATLVLLDKLIAEGVTLRYSGDFDPEGLLIAERLLLRYPGKVRLWRYSIEEYRLALSHKRISDTRLKQLRKIKSIEFQNLAHEMEHTGRAGYQEGILELLKEDLI
ncbi:TIGR02679 family protein [Paradesulfitobacterium ferrireducens]|uniref:TIGR02679 family protein n=1 Tax=Paradesulfitobacterium ferrireducens TaxID=2816476 RepID=UPI001A8F3F12|nr:TIGR02679 family protein [Paradesulfitobacterium ferrireducens]